MLKRFSDLSDDRLAYFVSRIREIAALDEASALRETDKLLCKAAQEVDPDNDYEDDEGDNGADERADVVRATRNVLDEYPYEDVKRLMDTLRVAIAEERIKRRDIATLQRRYKHLSEARYHYGQRSANDEEKGMIADLYRCCEQTIRDAEMVYLVSVVHEGMTTEYGNINSARAFLATLDAALEPFVGNTGINDDVTRQVREVRERAARFRSDRKLANAKIADAADQTGKAAGLRKEAAALLAADWEMVFPGEAAPTV